MKIVTGLFDHTVLQRDARSQSNAHVTGTCQTSGVLQARVASRSKRAGAARWMNIGRAKGGRFEGHLRGVAAGGPYSIELRISGDHSKNDETVTTKNVMVGDVWLVAGQSNMHGTGSTADAAAPHARVRALYMDDHWAVARDPIHQTEIAVDAVHNGGKQKTAPAKNPRGAGPAIAFGKEMLRVTGVPQGLVPCAHGGTSMSQWDPALKKLGGKSLYGALVRRLKTNGGKIAGMIWYQGESDANPEAVPHFTSRMKKLIAAVRRDAGNPTLPVVQVQLARYVGATSMQPSWNSIQVQQQNLDAAIQHFATTPAIDLPLEDAIHISGAAEQILGRRLAYAMHVLREGGRAGKPPITFRKVSIQRDEIRGTTDVIVEFDNVVDELIAAGKPAGFSLGDLPCIYDVRLEKNRAILRTIKPLIGLTSHDLCYGWGTEPYCNITDRAGRSLPVFGPHRVPGETGQWTPFIKKMSISPTFPSAGKLHSLAYPNIRKISWGTIIGESAPSNFINVQPQLEKFGLKDVLLYFKCQIDCPEPMKLKAGLGYDGPVKLWVDSKMIFHDPNGTNPAIADRANPTFTASKGTHDIVVALGSNSGNAWGIFLRFARIVSQRDTGTKRSAAPVIRE